MVVKVMKEQQTPGEERGKEPQETPSGRHTLPSDMARLRTQIRKLVLMKETGPKSAAWHRARVQTIWRLHRQASADSTSTGDEVDSPGH